MLKGIIKDETVDDNSFGNPFYYIMAPKIKFHLPKIYRKMNSLVKILVYLLVDKIPEIVHAYF